MSPMRHQGTRGRWPSSRWIDGAPDPTALGPMAPMFQIALPATSPAGVTGVGTSIGPVVVAASPQIVNGQGGSQATGWDAGPPPTFTHGFLWEVSTDAGATWAAYTGQVNLGFGSSTVLAAGTLVRLTVRNASGQAVTQTTLA